MARKRRPPVAERGGPVSGGPRCQGSVVARSAVGVLERPIAYAQYKGDGELAFFGVDKFVLPYWLDPMWKEK